VVKVTTQNDLTKEPEVPQEAGAHISFLMNEQIANYILRTDMAFEMLRFNPTMDTITNCLNVLKQLWKKIRVIMHEKVINDVEDNFERFEKFYKIYSVEPKRRIKTFGIYYSNAVLENRCIDFLDTADNIMREGLQSLQYLFKIKNRRQNIRERLGMIRGGAYDYSRRKRLSRMDENAKHKSAEQQHN
jgi:hypothetical protein